MALPLAALKLNEHLSIKARGITCIMALPLAALKLEIVLSLSGIQK